MKITHTLTERELEILTHVANGRTQKEVAGQLYVSPNTVNSHLRNIYFKLNVNSSPHAVAEAFRQHLIS